MQIREICKECLHKKDYPRTGTKAAKTECDLTFKTCVVRDSESGEDCVNCEKGGNDEREI